MATGAQTWSTAAASNNSADSSVNWAEGMAPSAVNDSARAEMASAAMWIGDNSGTLATSGTTAAYTVSSKQVSTAVHDGYTIAVKFHATNDAAATLNVDAIGAKNLQLAAGTNVAGGEFLSGSIHRFKYDSGSTAWVAFGGNLFGASAVSSNNIAAGAVAYSKIQNVAASSLLGNPTGSAASVSEITLGTGLSFSGQVISAPAYPPTSAYKNLSIKVTGTSSATLAADFVTMATSGSTLFTTLPLSSNLNFGAAGLVDQLDAGSVASNTWYAIYAIATTTSTVAHGLASTSFTTPAMPASYVYKARIGALITSTSTASAQLMGTWQFGNKTRYVVGLAQTTAARVMASTGGGQIGNVLLPTWVSQSTTNFVPSTASCIEVSALAEQANQVTAVAPNNSYGSTTSLTNPPPLVANCANSAGMSCLGEILLESTNVYIASNGAGSAWICYGWADNI